MPRPKTAAEEDSCARKIIATLARRAYRGDVTDLDQQRLFAFYQDGRRTGHFERGIQKALQRILAGPKFAFHVERDPAGVAPGTVYRISDLELASRLSFFVWSEGPDDALRAVAAAGKLHEPAELDRQIDRMLADPRANSLVTNFAFQWLNVGRMDNIVPDPILYPDFDRDLRAHGPTVRAMTAVLALRGPGGEGVWVDEHIALGHRRFGFLKGPPDHLAAVLRYDGFVDALRDAGLDSAPWTVEGDFTFKSGVEAAEKLLRESSQITALACANDDMAAGAMLALHRAGLEIPSAISVTGFDDTPMSEIIWPPLTTVRQPIKDLAERAVHLLFETNGQVQREEVPHSLVVRESTAPPNKFRAA